jgi:hypothetical protein
MNAQSKTGPVDFDLARGRVDTGGDHRVVLVPVPVLSEMAKLAGLESIKEIARSVGVSFGRRVAAKLGSGDGVTRSSLEGFVSSLASEIAVSGWGALRLERWGKALVLVVEHAPDLPTGALAALLEGAVEAAAAREVHAVALNGDGGNAAAGGVARVLLVGAKAAERARLWLAEGATERDVLGRLQEPKPAGGAA